MRTTRVFGQSFWAAWATPGLPCKSTSDCETPSHGPTWVSYPTILEQPPAQLLAYNRETTIAEKFEAMVKLGEVNTRMKDFFDIWLLAANFEFDGLSLLAAIRATFAQRQTPLEVVPIGLSDVFGRDPSKEAQVESVSRALAPTARAARVLRGRGPCSRLHSAGRTSHFRGPTLRKALAARRSVEVGNWRDEIIRPSVATANTPGFGTGSWPR